VQLPRRDPEVGASKVDAETRTTIVCASKDQDYDEFDGWEV
jgi:hypothetical protein